jgi:menaquinone-dependent protoporphyrinogen oxidase
VLKHPEDVVSRHPREALMARILILYGTTDGHTVRIAESIRDTLLARGDQVDVVEAGRTGPNPADYAGIVVAASVHGGRYQRHVRSWVRTNVYALDNKPTAFVSVSLGVLQQEPEVQREVQAIVTRFLLSTGWRPTITKNVAGALMYRKYGWFKRWIMKRITAKAGGNTDTGRNWIYTDWSDVRVFAEQFATLVHGWEAAAVPSRTTQAA